MPVLVDKWGVALFLSTALFTESFFDEPLNDDLGYEAHHAES